MFIQRVAARIRRAAARIRKILRRSARHVRIHRSKFYAWQRQFELFPGTETSIEVTPTQNKQARLKIVKGSEMILTATLGLSNAGIYVHPPGEFMGNTFVLDKEAPILLPRDHVCDTDNIIVGRVRKPVFDIHLELKVTAIPLRSNLLVDTVDPDPDIVQDDKVNMSDLRGYRISFRSSSFWSESEFTADIFLNAYTHEPLSLYLSTRGDTP